METNKEEALKVKEYAEKRFADKDFAGAKNFALKAQSLYPELEGISQMIATFDVYVASEVKINGEIDFYKVLGLKPTSDRSMVKKQYKKLAVMLHPDKNRTVGADGAFRLVSEAWTRLSDSLKRASSYNTNNVYVSGAYGVNSLPPTFWTICTSCQVQYEYLRKYVNKRLSCKNCRAAFMAVELGTAPISGSYPVGTWSYNGYGYNDVSYVPGSTVFVSGNGIPGYQSGHGSDPGSSVSFQWTGSSGPYIDPNSSVGTKNTGSYKRRKVVEGYEGNNVIPEGTTANGNNGKIYGPTDPSTRILPVPPAIDVRNLLIEKARTLIRNKLEEMKLVTAAAAATAQRNNKTIGRRRENAGPSGGGPLTLTVPDPDFHDFDRDRAEECFKPKQIWALYDEEDGMPRLYCLIRHVISINPFKIQVSYLNSKTDTEFGLVNWITSGFTKSCGHFRAFNSEVIDQVNIFSHLLAHEKAGRGGCVRIFPRTGDVWALYRDWSPDWNRRTPDEVRHRYEMVEVLEGYTEEFGVRVTPLGKVDGFKTVYQKETNEDSVRWIPRREMVRFSHQVPSWLINGISGLPDGCWDLDPAATPIDLLPPEPKPKPEPEPEPEPENGTKPEPKPEPEPGVGP